MARLFEHCHLQAGRQGLVQGAVGSMTVQLARETGTSRGGPRAWFGAGGTLVSIAGPPDARPADGVVIDFVAAALNPANGRREDIRP